MFSQQSWTAWILDSYASIAPSQIDPAVDLMADSPYGPYVRTGRGGAGNYQWQSQQQDPEAAEPVSLQQKRNVAGQIEAIDTAAAMRDSQAKNTDEYARVGRGGAGNYAYRQSNEPQRSPTSLAPKSSPVVYTGRGGAGNYGAVKNVVEQSKSEREEHDREEAKRRREQAEREVEHILQPPSQAYTGAVKRSGLPDDM